MSQPPTRRALLGARPADAIPSGRVFLAAYNRGEMWRAGRPIGFDPENPEERVLRARHPVGAPRHGS